MYRVDGETGATREVSTREWSLDKMPNEPLLTTQWPLCRCYRCKGNGTMGEMRRQRA
ncbi:hypothetical protein [Streptomyces sp. NPDC055692]|uniref:hypothetical protein n=1 Tax=Streptomyces sp. NPDC055692 TaxID=3155683 RepID=UPI00341C5F8D